MRIQRSRGGSLSRRASARAGGQDQPLSPHMQTHTHSSPSPQDTWGARFTTQLTSQVALEALATCLEKEERAAAAFELVAQRVLSPAQYAVAYVTGDPSMPDWLAISNLLFHDPSRQAAATVAAVAAVTTVVAHATSGGPRASGCGPASASGTAAAPDSESGEVVVNRKGGGRAKRASGA